MNPLLVLGLVGGGLYAAKKIKEKRDAEQAAEDAEVATTVATTGQALPTCTSLFEARMADSTVSLPPGVTEAQMREVFVSACRAAPAEKRLCFSATEPSAECMPTLMPLMAAVMRMASPPAGPEREAMQAALRAERDALMAAARERATAVRTDRPSAATDTVIRRTVAMKFEPQGDEPEVPAAEGIGSYVRSYY